MGKGALQVSGRPNGRQTCGLTAIQNTLRGRTDENVLCSRSHTLSPPSNQEADLLEKYQLFSPKHQKKQHTGYMKNQGTVGLTWVRKP
jgi:hypothetical protein